MQGGGGVQVWQGEMANAKALGWEIMTERSQESWRVVSEGEFHWKRCGKGGQETRSLQAHEGDVRSLDLIASTIEKYWKVHGLGKRQDPV